MDQAIIRFSLFITLLVCTAPTGCSKSSSTAGTGNSDKPGGDSSGNLSATMNAGNRRDSTNNLRQIGLAFLNYHDQNNYLPTGITDPSGKPLLSWRVAILPLIEQENLFKAFHLNEPWDSEHNKKLIAKMPKTYQLPGVGSREEGKTYYRQFVSFANDPPNLSAVFPIPAPGKTGPVLRASIASVSDGMSNTLLAAEAAEPVIWTKPDELIYHPSKPVPALLRDKTGKCFVLVGDGSVRPLTDKLSEETLRALITARNGEVVADW